MIQRASAPPRGPRNASPSVRGGGRGGIQKRRAGTGPVRVDKDGDLVMDAATAGDRRKSGKGRLESPAPSKPHGSGRGSGATARGGSPGTHKTQQAILRGIGAQQANVLESRITTGGTALQIDGLKSSKAASNPDGGLESLLAFLERKASGLDAASNRTVKIKKSHMRGDSVIITASPEDIAQIQKLNNFTFAGTSLVVQACEPASLPLSAKSGEKKKEGPSPGVQETKDRIQAVLAGRYDPGLKLLNLSALGRDPDLVQMGMFEENKTSSKLFPALMAVCDGLFKTRQEKVDAIDSVTLADNELVDLAMVFRLAQTFPDLKNLDLSRNKFSDTKSLDSWRTKFRHLERLLLKDNPIEKLSPTYHVDITKWFPTLRFLNDTQVRTLEEIAAATAAAEAAKSPIPITGPDFRDVAQVGENFVRQFISLYDSDRTALLTNFYDTQSVHSISVNMSAPRDPEHSTAIPPWADYTKYSRNLVKITHPGPRMSRRFRGVKDIQPVWSSLPATRHPDLQTQADKYLIECHPLPGLSDPTGQSARGVDGLILTMHGEFEEKNDSTTEKALRSFSRTFVLGPGAPGGPPIRVISDMMVLRAWGPLASPMNVASPPAKINMGNQEQQQQQEALTMQLVEKTGMTPNYAMLCLTETGWDLEKAFVAFNANKDKLPPDAFISAVRR